MTSNFASSISVINFFQEVISVPSDDAMGYSTATLLLHLMY